MEVHMERNTLNSQQRRFVLEYLKDHNATGAARRAGYSARSAAQYGHELLRKPAIQRALRMMVSEQNTEALVARDRILNELGHIAYDRRLRPKDRIAALDKLAKYTEAFERAARDYPEFLNAAERLDEFLAMIPEQYKFIQAIMTLLLPQDQDRLVKAFEQRAAEDAARAEAVRRGQLPRDTVFLSASSAGYIEFLKEALGADRIAESIAMRLGQLFADPLEVLYSPNQRDEVQVQFQRFRAARELQGEPPADARTA
jgi:phage terminase small subunit